MKTPGIVLDTNVLSEPKRPTPDARVAAWFEAQAPDRLYLTSIAIAEIAFGIRILGDGRRRRALERWLEQVVLPTFHGRILFFESDDALVYGALMAEARKAGRKPSTADGQIAAIVRRHGFTLATRNTSHFAVFDLPLIDPWAASA